MSRTLKTKAPAVWITLAVFVLSCIFATSVYSFADTKEALSFSFDKEQVAPSETITGYLMVNSGDVTNGQITITYDKDKLELLKAEKSPGQADDTYVSINSRTAGKVIIALAAMEPVKTGALVDLVFKADKDLKSGDKIRLDGGEPEIYDSMNEPVKNLGLTKTFTVKGSDDGKTDPTTDGDKDNTKPSDNGKKDPSDNSGQSSPTKDDKNGSASKTGDSHNMAVYMTAGVIALAALAVAAVLLRRRTGKNDSR